MKRFELLPAVDRTYEGPDVPFYFLIAIAAASTIRSLIHLLAPDGGAASIAGFAIHGEGGRNLVAIFAQWGASQLILAILYWIVILRYRFLTPLMLAVVALEQCLRLAGGFLKPPRLASPPPGAVASRIILPLAVAMLAWSLSSLRKTHSLSARRPQANPSDES
jgi:hypothetical protein